MSWEVDEDVFIERDEDDYARHVRHIQSPYNESGRRNPYDLALDYLQQMAGEFGLEYSQLAWLSQNRPAKENDEEGACNAKATGPQLRWRARRRLRGGETVVLVAQQTHDVPIRIRADFGRGSPVEGIGIAHLDVRGAGVRIVMHRRRGQLSVTGATSTLRHNFNFAHAKALAESGHPFDLTPRRRARLRFGTLTAEVLISMGLANIHNDIGLSDAQGSERGLWIWRYETSGVDRVPQTFLRRRHRDDVQPGADYAVLIERHEPFFIDDTIKVGLDSAPFDIVVRLGDNRVLATIPLMAGAATAARRSRPPKGYVFPTDPISATGDFGLRPNQPSDKLERVRRRVSLPVDPPTQTQPNYRLRGDHVVILDHTERNKPGLGYGGQGFDPPSEPPGDDFSYDVRTNDFAAVNAYWHLDGMFRRLRKFGLDFQSWMPKPKFARKAEVIHRAAIQPGGGGDGRVVNAQLRVRPGISGGTTEQALHRLEFRFALADLSLRPGAPRTYDADGNPRPEHLNTFPLGVACDSRWVWHEFGHALIVGATGDLELRFAHSVGDALAAINGDPESALAGASYAAKYRGVTFPWVNLPLRRHDRDASLGWSWNGVGRIEGYAQDTGDTGGYRREQVLSSTLFRLYRAAGGDTTDDRGRPVVWRRRQIADYVSYLIARALASLGPAPTVPARDASVFATALMDADAATNEFRYEGLPPDPVGQRRVGGTLHKVIRWAFEKQGLYANGAAMVGAPPPADVYVDHMGGEYDWRADWHTANSEVWARPTPDGLAGHEAPLAGQTSYLYVRARNRGYDAAFGVTATVRAAEADDDLCWPDRRAWRELPPRTVEDAKGDITAAGSVVLGPFPWNPRSRGLYTILVELDAPGDRSNLNPASGLPCAQTTARPTRLGRIARFDNNLAAIDVRVA